MYWYLGFLILVQGILYPRTYKREDFYSCFHFIYSHGILPFSFAFFSIFYDAKMWPCVIFILIVLICFQISKEICWKSDFCWHSILSVYQILLCFSDVEDQKPLKEKLKDAAKSRLYEVKPCKTPLLWFKRYYLLYLTFDCLKSTWFLLSSMTAE